MTVKEKTREEIGLDSFLQEILTHPEKEVRKLLLTEYPYALMLVDDEDEEVRIELAKRGIAWEVLRYDESPMVLATIFQLMCKQGTLDIDEKEEEATKYRLMRQFAKQKWNHLEKHQLFACFQKILQIEKEEDYLFLHRYYLSSAYYLAAFVRDVDWMIQESLKKGRNEIIEELLLVAKGEERVLGRFIKAGLISEGMEEYPCYVGNPSFWQDYFSRSTREALAKEKERFFTYLKTTLDRHFSQKEGVREYNQCHLIKRALDIGFVDERILENPKEFGLPKINCKLFS